jgi:hypothetical protein
MRVLGLDRRVAEATKDMAQTLVILGPSPSHSDENLVLTGALGATNADIATVGVCSLEGRERIMFLFRRATSKHAARASCMYIVTPRTWMMMTTTTTERKGRSSSCLPACLPGVHAFGKSGPTGRQKTLMRLNPDWRRKDALACLVSHTVLYLIKV